MAFGSETEKSRISCVSVCSTGGVAVLFTKMRTWREKGINQELYFRHVKFEMLIRHLGGQAVKQNAKEESRVGGVSLESISS